MTETIWNIPLTDTTLDDAEVAAAARVLRSGWLTQGAEVAAFETEFAALLGARHAVAVANGTAALHLAYEAAGLREGAEFLVPALTFIATINAGLYLRAKPVLVDCASENDLTLSVGDLERKLTPAARLIVTMPYGGFPPDMTRIRALADSRAVPVVEDACHAPLAARDGRAIGTFGLASTYSFFGNKNMTTGEGGMVLTDDDAVAARVRLLRSHGMTTLTYDRHRGHASAYDVAALGYNQRMDEIRAAVGREQLKKLPGATERRRVAARGLRQALEPLESEGLVIPFKDAPGLSANHLFVVLLPPDRDREAFRAHLAEQGGIQTSVHYPSPRRFTHCREAVAGAVLPVLDAIETRLVTLPMGPNLTEAQIDHIAEATRAALRAAP